MREIKFRGKCNNYLNQNSEEKNKWIYGNLSVLNNKPAQIQDKDDLNWWKYVDIETVGQYTGLQDKNGKEIYEGDIVKIPSNYEEYGINAGEIYEVYFAYGGFRLKAKYNQKEKGYWLEDTEELEIIGNIYDNKELLED